MHFTSISELVLFRAPELVLFEPEEWLFRAPELVLFEPEEWLEERSA